MFPGFLRNMEMRCQEVSGNELGLRSFPDSTYKVDGAIVFLLLTEQSIEMFFLKKQQSEKSLVWISGCILVSGNSYKIYHHAIAFLLSEW